MVPVSKRVGGSRWTLCRMFLAGMCGGIGPKSLGFGQPQQVGYIATGQEVFGRNRLESILAVETGAAVRAALVSSHTSANPLRRAAARTSSRSRLPKPWPRADSRIYILHSSALDGLNGYNPAQPTIRFAGSSSMTSNTPPRLKYFSSRSSRSLSLAPVSSRTPNSRRTERRTARIAGRSLACQPNRESGKLAWVKFRTHDRLSRHFNRNLIGFRRILQISIAPVASSGVERSCDSHTPSDQARTATLHRLPFIASIATFQERQSFYVLLHADWISCENARKICIADARQIPESDQGFRRGPLPP